MLRLLELSQILNPGVPNDRLPPIMAVGFYADESETAGLVFTLAGFIATPSAWDLFTPKWRQMLCNTGPYPVDAFHAADIENAQPPFDGWPIEDRRQLVANAMDLLADTTLCSNLYAVSCTFVIEDMRAVEPRLVGNSTADIYERCYRVLFHNILNRWVFNDIAFIFDNKEKVKGRVQGHFDRSRAILEQDPQYRGKLGASPIFADDRKVIPLQAADLLAYEIRRHAWTRLTKGDDAPVRDAYQRIKDSFQVNPEKPPYRERLFRCYDRRFLASALEKAATNPTEQEFIDFWYLADAPED